MRNPNLRYYTQRIKILKNRKIQFVDYFIPVIQRTGHFFIALFSFVRKKRGKNQYLIDIDNKYD